MTVVTNAEAVITAGDALAQVCEVLGPSCNEHDRREIAGRIAVWRRVCADLEERARVFEGATAKMAYPEGTFLVGTVTLNRDEAPAGQPPEAHPMHQDCIPCIARAHQHDGEEATLALLILLKTVLVQQVWEDLCFEHARKLGLTAVPPEPA